MLDSVVRFGLFEVDTHSAELRRDGVRIPIQDLPFRLLCLLLERAGEVVTREELREQLWAPGVHVEYDNNIGFKALDNAPQLLPPGTLAADYPAYVDQETDNNWGNVLAISRALKTISARWRFASSTTT